MQAFHLVRTGTIKLYREGYVNHIMTLWTSFPQHHPSFEGEGSKNKV